MTIKDTPAVRCNLTDSELDARSTAVLASLVERFNNAKEREDGYTYEFEGGIETFEAVSRFVADESECCPFATFRIEWAPPYNETRLTVTGPEGTKRLFDADLVGCIEERLAD